MKQKSDRKKVLGIEVDVLNRQEVLEKISGRIESPEKQKPIHIITAYSEFFVTAQKDPDFKRVLDKADLVIADGVGPLSAVNYLDSLQKSHSVALKLIRGAITGVKIVAGQVGETVPGVWLFSKLIEESSRQGWKVFLLGGFGDVSYRLEKQLLNNYPNLKIQSDPGAQKLDLDIEQGETLLKINAFKPDILFVAYGPVKQEKWIAENLNKLQVKVAIGVGGTFDELTGKVRPAPEFITKMGLKWLWRLKEEPKRLRRIFNAFPVFPLMVFKEALRRR